MRQSDGYLPNLVVAQIYNLQVGIGAPTELFHICDLFHMQVHLLLLRGVLKDRRHSCKTVSIQREVGQVRQVHLVSPNLLELFEKAQ